MASGMSKWNPRSWKIPPKWQKMPAVDERFTKEAVKIHKLQTCTRTKFSGTSTKDRTSKKSHLWNNQLWMLQGSYFKYFWPNTSSNQLRAWHEVPNEAPCPSFTGIQLNQLLTHWTVSADLLYLSIVVVNFPIQSMASVNLDKRLCSTGFVKQKWTCICKAPRRSWVWRFSWASMWASSHLRRHAAWRCWRAAAVLKSARTLSTSSGKGLSARITQVFSSGKCTSKASKDKALRNTWHLGQALRMESLWQFMS